MSYLKNYRRPFSFVPVILILLIMLVSELFSVQKEAPAHSLSLCFVDVGQGDSVFLKTPEGETWLIDGGEYDAFDFELKSFLAAWNVDKIDFALVTHYHSDHMGGIAELLKRGRIENLIIPDYTPDGNAKTNLLKLAKKADTRVLEVSEGDILPDSNANLEISVLHPQIGGFSEDNENSNSLVLRLEYFDTSVLLTGDLEQDAEKSLARKYNLETDILKIGHHGSATSTSDMFLQKTNPTYGIISAGSDNRYGHPHREVLSRLSDDDVLVYRTDEDGDISFFLTEKGIETIKTETNYNKEQ